MPKVQPIPDGHHTLTPTLTVKDARRAIAYYEKAFGAELVGRVAEMPDGKVGHAELSIGDSRLMLNDEFPTMGSAAPRPEGPSSTLMFLYVPNADAVFDAAVAAGAKVLMPLADQFWGDRYGVVVDPFGHRWGIATHKEDLTPEQIDERMKKTFAGAK